MNSGSNLGTSLRAAIHREQTLNAGHFEFRVERGEVADYLSETMREELKEPVEIEFVRISSNQFRLILRKDGNVIREIVADGVNVSTGDGSVWDIGYLTDWPLTVHLHKKKAFMDVMWPYFDIVLHHLHPLAQNGASSIQDFASTYRIGRSAKASLPGEIIVRGEAGPVFYEYTLDTERGYAPILVVMGVNGAPVFVYDFEEWLKAGDDIWLPVELTHSLFNDDGERITRWRSNLVSASVVADSTSMVEEFSVDTTDVNYIAWPEETVPAALAELFVEAFSYGYDPEFLPMYLVLFCMFAAVVVYVGLLLLKWTKKPPPRPEN